MEELIVQLRCYSTAEHLFKLQEAGVGIALPRLQDAWARAISGARQFSFSAKERIKIQHSRIMIVYAGSNGWRAFEKPPA
jgi:hypothetical protein